MRKVFCFLAVATFLLTACRYDDSELLGRVGNLEERVDRLETLCNQMNTNISSLQTIISALQQKDYIESITPITEGKAIIGYTITFSQSAPITIYHGKDGKDGEDGKDGVDGVDGKDGYTPVIGVRQDTDGIYYWTLDGEWLLDENGNKIKAEGTNGKDGSNGEDGKDGEDGSGSNGSNGKDGITPKLKIENGYWFVSYDNGSTWTELGRAIGENGKDGTSGDSFFQSVDTSNKDYVVFKLSNGTEIKLPTWTAFENIQTLCNQMNTNIASLQTIVNALQENDYIKSVTPVMENGKEIGYTITFAKSNAIIVYHGKDGANGTNGSNGENGNTPIIGVKQDTDGIYYWTVDKEWLLDDAGNKVKALGADGSDGENGANGTNGITPKLKIEDGYWCVSYDNGATWTELGKATGEDGDNIFSSVTQDENSVYFNLVNGTTITIPKNASNTPKPTDFIQFEDVNVKALCLKWDTNYDGELSYEEAAKVQSLGTTFKEETSIRLFKELQYFTGISSLESSFYGCTNLVLVMIPSTVKTMDDAFSSCSSLIRVTIPDSVTELNGTFNGCKSLSSITIPNSVVKVGGSTFYNCNQLTSLTFPDNVKTIGSSVIMGCTSMTTVTIGKNVETIGYHGLRRSVSGGAIKTLYCKSFTPPTLDGEIFATLGSGTNYIPTIYVPTEVVDVYKTSDSWKQYSSKIQGYVFNE